MAQSTETAEKQSHEDLVAAMSEIMSGTASPPPQAVAPQVTVYLPSGKSMLLWQVDARERIEAGEVTLSPAPPSGVPKVRTTKAPLPATPAVAVPRVATVKPATEKVEKMADAGSPGESLDPPEPKVSIDAQALAVMSRPELRAAYKKKVGRVAPGNASEDWMRGKLA